MHRKDLERILKGLANRRRLAILACLLKSKEMSVADVAGCIKLSFKATSKHLAILRQLDIVDRRQQGLTMHYSVSKSLPKAVKPFIPFISNSRE